MFKAHPGDRANLSTSRMIDDLAAAPEGAAVVRSAVGEANVVAACGPTLPLRRCGQRGVIEPRVGPRDSLVGWCSAQLMATTTRASPLVEKIRATCDQGEVRVRPRRIARCWTRSARPTQRADQRLRRRAGGLPQGWVTCAGSNTEPSSAYRRARPARLRRLAQPSGIADRLILRLLSCAFGDHRCARGVAVRIGWTARATTHIREPLNQHVKQRYEEDRQDVWPRACRRSTRCRSMSPGAPAPSPEPRHTPRMNASDVMTIGRIAEPRRLGGRSTKCPGLPASATKLHYLIASWPPGTNWSQPDMQ